MSAKGESNRETASYISIPQLLKQFKSHIWSYLEYANGAGINASHTERKRLDAMQSRFLVDIGCDEQEAFVTHNFAPLGFRRAIGMLGLLSRKWCVSEVVCDITCFRVVLLKAGKRHGSAIVGQ